jgi:hypothetical protein
LATIDYGLGEREFRCTYWTLTVYEQEFRDDPCRGVTGDLIADVFGKIRATDESLGFHLDEDGNLDALVIDYTLTNWNVEKRALWAMLRTQSDIDQKRGRESERVPSYAEWEGTLVECEPDLRELSNAICGELQRGLFRAGAAASGKTSE